MNYYLGLGDEQSKWTGDQAAWTAANRALIIAQRLNRANLLLRDPTVVAVTIKSGQQASERNRLKQLAGQITKNYIQYLDQIGGKPGTGASIIAAALDTSEGLQKVLSFGLIKTTWDKSGVQVLDNLLYYEKLVQGLLIQIAEVYNIKSLYAEVKLSAPKIPAEPFGIKDMLPYAALGAVLYFAAPLLLESGRAVAQMIKSKSVRKK